MYGPITAQRGLDLWPFLGWDVGSHDFDNATHLDLGAGPIRLSGTRIVQRLELLGGPQSGVDADVHLTIDQSTERLVHDALIEGHRRESGGQAVHEVNLGFPGPAFNDLAVGGAGNLLNREVPGSVVTDRIDGHPISLAQRGFVFPKGA